MGEYRWYTVIDGEEPFQQGDFVFSCPIVIPIVGTKPESEIETDIAEFNVIVMSQSCDLRYKKLEIVLVCPFQALNEIADFKSAGTRNKLRQGNVIGYHMLNKCDIEGFKTDYLIVDFRNVYGTPFKYLEKRRDKRLRLLPPYREQLSQNFARFFMRVGLPSDIPPFS